MKSHRDSWHCKYVGFVNNKFILKALDIVMGVLEILQINHDMVSTAGSIILMKADKMRCLILLKIMYPFKPCIGAISS